MSRLTLISPWNSPVVEVVDAARRGLDPDILAIAAQPAIGRGERFAGRGAGAQFPGFLHVVGMDEAQIVAVLQLFGRAHQDAAQRAGGEGDAAFLVQHDDVGGVFGHHAVDVFGPRAVGLGDHLLRDVVADADQRDDAPVGPDLDLAMRVDEARQGIRVLGLGAVVERRARADRLGDLALQVRHIVRHDLVEQPCHVGLEFGIDAEQRVHSGRPGWVWLSASRTRQ